MKNLKLYGSFLWMRFNCLKATGPLCEDSLLFTTQSPGVPGTHLINFDGIKGLNNLDHEATQQIWTQDPELGIQRLKRCC